MPDRNVAGFLRRDTGDELGPIVVAGSVATTGGDVGAWSYRAGSSGSVNVPAGARVIGVAAIATSAGASMSIGGGDAVPIPQNFGPDLTPKGNLVGPVTITFTGTASYIVEWVT